MRICTGHGVKLQENSVQINESGVDFKAVVAKDEDGVTWILRIPRRESSMRAADQEKQVLDVLQSKADFEVPVWTVFSEELIGYQALQGKPAAVIDLEVQDYVWHIDKDPLPDAYYATLGHVMAEIHNIPVQLLQGIDLPRVKSEDVQASMRQRMEHVKQCYHVHPDRWHMWQTWLDDKSIWPPHNGFYHGDLHPGHIMVNENSQVTGLLDWTEAGMGDVSTDFLSHYLLFGREGLDRLLAAYADAGGRVWPKMAEHIVALHHTSGITVAEYAAVSGLSDMEEMAREMLKAPPES
nr:macrolide 2'-phosphotransferase [Salisediminibacterium beveridgei]